MEGDGCSGGGLLFCMAGAGGYIIVMECVHMLWVQLAGKYERLPQVDWRRICSG